MVAGNECNERESFIMMGVRVGHAILSSFSSLFGEGRLLLEMEEGKREGEGETDWEIPKETVMGWLWMAGFFFPFGIGDGLFFFLKNITVNFVLVLYKYFLFFILYLDFWDRASCKPSWTHTGYIAEDDLELHVLLSLPHKWWN